MTFGRFIFGLLEIDFRRRRRCRDRLPATDGATGRVVRKFPLARPI